MTAATRIGWLASVIVALVVGLTLGVRVGGEGEVASGPPTTTVPSPTTEPWTPTTTTQVPPTTTPSDPTPWPERDEVGVPDGLLLAQQQATVVDVDGTVLDGRRIVGGLIVRADNVTITRSQIEGNRRLVVECDGCTGLRIEDSTIFGTGDATQGCVGRSDYTLRRVLISGCIDGAKANARVLIEDSWIGDLRRVGSSHNDAVQGTGGNDIVIRRNQLVHDTGGQTSAMKQSADRAPLTNIVVEQNRLITSTCLALYVNIQSGASWPAPTGRIVDNVVSGNTCPDWGRLDRGPGLLIEGNTDPDGLALAA